MKTSNRQRWAIHTVVAAMSLIVSTFAFGAAGQTKASTQTAQGGKQIAAQGLDKVLAGDWRSDENKARDKYRHPQQTLNFFGVTDKQTVIEITPAGGWYAEILAPWLKDSGQYIAAITTPRKSSGEDAQDKSALEKKFTADPTHYSKTKVVQFDGKAPHFGDANSADTVLTFRNVHNWTMAKTDQLMFKAFFDVLKPGGVLGVVDHRAAPGADLTKIMQSGYLPEDYVIKLATGAGFKLAAKSDINANPKDTKDYEKGYGRCRQPCNSVTRIGEVSGDRRVRPYDAEIHQAER